MGLGGATYPGAHLPDRVTVPTRRGGDSARIEGALYIPAADVADSLRAVCHLYRRNSETGNGVGVEAVGLSGNHADLFVESHLRHEFHGAVLVFLGDLGGGCAYLKHQCGNGQEQCRESFHK